MFASLLGGGGETTFWQGVLGEWALPGDTHLLLTVRIARGKGGGEDCCLSSCLKIIGVSKKHQVGPPALHSGVGAFEVGRPRPHPCLSRQFQVCPCDTWPPPVVRPELLGPFKAPFLFLRANRKSFPPSAGPASVYSAVGVVRCLCMQAWDA